LNKTRLWLSVHQNGGITGERKLLCSYHFSPIIIILLNV